MSRLPVWLALTTTAVVSLPSCGGDGGGSGSGLGYGTFRGRLRQPSTVRVIGMDPERIIAVERAALDVESVVVYRIVEPA